jgi:hypothetical protein
MAVANGFALVQLQRRQVGVSRQALSAAPDWAVKAYQCLKVLLPSHSNAVTPDSLDFVVFHYFSRETAVREQRPGWGVAGLVSRRLTAS